MRGIGKQVKKSTQDMLTQIYAIIHTFLPPLFYHFFSLSSFLVFHVVSKCLLSTYYAPDAGWGCSKKQNKKIAYYFWNILLRLFTQFFKKILLGHLILIVLFFFACLTFWIFSRSKRFLKDYLKPYISPFLFLKTFLYGEQKLAKAKIYRNMEIGIKNVLTRFIETTWLVNNLKET